MYCYYIITLISSLCFGFANIVCNLFLSKKLFARFGYTKLSPLKQYVWNEKLMSMLHGIISTIGAFICIFDFMINKFDWSLTRLLDSAKSQYNLPQASIWMEITLGYFMYDTVLIGSKRSTKPPEYVHHVISAVQYALMIWYGWALYIPIFLQTNEFSTPFLHISWFMIHSPAKDSVAHKVVQLLFAVFFILFRIIFNVFVVVLTVYTAIYSWPPFLPDAVPIISIVAICLFYVVQWVWVFGIFKQCIPQIKAAIGPKKRNYVPVYDDSEKEALLSNDDGGIVVGNGNDNIEESSVDAYSENSSASNTLVFNENVEVNDLASSLQ